MRILLNLAIISTFITVAFAACGIDNIDLSGLTRTTDWNGKDASYSYNMNVCAPSNKPDCASGICQTADKVYKFGSWDKATWAYIDASDKTKGVKASFTDGDDCWQGTPQPRPVTVLFPCAGSDASEFTVSEDPKCTFTMQLPTTKSCPGGPGPKPTPGGGSSGLSGGWIFIIILLVVIPVYIVGGCIYKTKKLGTSGKESCPNIEFWGSLPGLVKDGFKFTIGGCKRGTSYGQL